MVCCGFGFGVWLLSVGVGRLLFDLDFCVVLGWWFLFAIDWLLWCVVLGLPYSVVLSDLVVSLQLRVLFWSDFYCCQFTVSVCVVALGLVCLCGFPGHFELCGLL